MNFYFIHSSPFATTSRTNQHTCQPLLQVAEEKIIIIGDITEV